MASPEPSMDRPLSVRESVEEAERTAREQLAAAWQLQVEHLQEQLDSGWRENLDRVVQERFGELNALLEEKIGAAVEQAMGGEVEKRAAEARVAARFELSESLNRTVRLLRQFESEAQWCNSLLDASLGYCGRGALFAVGNHALRFLGERSSEPEAVPETDLPEVSLDAAPAFAAAVASGDTVVAVCTHGEISEPISRYFGESADQKVYLFPLVTRERVVGVLYAEGGRRPVEGNALELLCSVAAAVLECHLASETRRPSNVVSIAAAPAADGGAAPSWAALSGEEQELHLRAQRFARVRVAEMRLYKSGAVKEGRAGANLYGTLKQEIDSGRQEFRDQFMTSATMVDYFHVELVRTLANDDAALLGSEYPGPLG